VGRVAGVLALQRSAGNRATTAALSKAARSRTLARCPGCGGTCGGGKAASCEHSLEDEEARRRLREAVLARKAGSYERVLQRQPSSATSDASCTVHFRRDSTQTVDDVERDECLERARQYVAGGGQRSVRLHGYASEEGDAA
jgi:hypothetical protein